MILLSGYTLVVNIYAANVAWADNFTLVHKTGRLKNTQQDLTRMFKDKINQTRPVWSPLKPHEEIQTERHVRSLIHSETITTTMQ